METLRNRNVNGTDGIEYKLKSTTRRLSQEVYHNCHSTGVIEVAVPNEAQRTVGFELKRQWESNVRSGTPQVRVWPIHSM